MVRMPPRGGVLGMFNRKGIPGQSQDMLERLHLLAGLGLSLGSSTCCSNIDKWKLSSWYVQFSQRGGSGDWTTWEISKKSDFTLHKQLLQQKKDQSTPKTLTEKVLVYPLSGIFEHTWQCLSKCCQALWSRGELEMVHWQQKGIISLWSSWFTMICRCCEGKKWMQTTGIHSVFKAKKKRPKRGTHLINLQEKFAGWIIPKIKRYSSQN